MSTAALKGRLGSSPCPEEFGAEQPFVCEGEGYEARVHVFKILFERERERAQTGGGEGEADSPLSREPHMGLDPMTLGS